MAKNNIRSVRFSDELIEIIEQQVGDNFTQKFERLVYNCYMLLPEKERQLHEMEARYQKAKESYFALSDRYRDAQAFMNKAVTQQRHAAARMAEPISYAACYMAGCE